MSDYGIIVILMLTVLAQCRAEDCPSDSEHKTLQEGRLYYHLTCAHDSDYRPVKDHKSSVDVKVRFALKYINFDSQEEVITLHSWVALTWKDEFLTWNPSDYGDMKEIQVESHTIWTPRLALFNADASSYPTDSIYTTCLVTSEGAVTCVPPLAHSGICQTTLRNWPYDIQNCTLFFGSWMHTGEQVNFTFYKSKPVVLDDFQNGPGWKLLEVFHERLPGKYSSSPNSTYPMLKYTFQLQRESAGPAAIVVVPTIVIVMLTLTSLLLDIKDNTRLMLACFSLFGHYNYLSEIGYLIPKHSADTPVILLFVRDSMIITLLAVLVTLVLMSLRSRTVPAYTWIVSLNRLVSNGPGKYVVFTEFDPSDISDNKTLNEDISGSHSNGGKANISTEWIQFSNFLNSCVFIIIFVTYLVLFCTYIPGKH